MTRTRKARRSLARLGRAGRQRPVQRPSWTAATVVSARRSIAACAWIAVSIFSGSFARHGLVVLRHLCLTIAEDRRRARHAWPCPTRTSSSRSRRRGAPRRPRARPGSSRRGSLRRHRPTRVASSASRMACDARTSMATTRSSARLSSARSVASSGTGACFEQAASSTNDSAATRRFTPPSPRAETSGSARGPRCRPTRCAALLDFLASTHDASMPRA